MNLRRTLQVAGLAGALGLLTLPTRASTSTQRCSPIAAAPSLHGRILDRNGAPVAGARVLAFLEHRPLSFLAEATKIFTSPRADVLSDSEGRFSISHLPPGRYVLVAIHGHHSPGRSGPVAIESGPLPVPLKVVLDGEVVPA
jgi:hypothetical protein